MVFKNTSQIRFLNKDEVFPSTFIPKSLVPDRYWENFVCIDGINYYLKRKDISLLLNELIGERIAAYFDLQTVTNLIASFEDPRQIKLDSLPFVLLTKLFFQPGEEYLDFYNFLDTEERQNTGMANLKAFSSFARNGDGKIITTEPLSLATLHNDLKKLIVVDFLMQQFDRNSCNFYFQHQGASVRLMPIFDYECSFDLSKRNVGYYFNTNLQDREAIDFVRGDSYFQHLMNLAIKLDIRNELEEVMRIYQIEFSRDEISSYERVILQKKDDIYSRNLIR